MSAYKTIAKPSQSEYKEMKSRFISFAYPISSPDEVKLLVDNLKNEYFDARHHCYAWRMDEQCINQQDGNTACCRTADDREPSHTAGEPILAAIDSNGLKNILIVVVRYFGGIKLGASNLAKAYRQAALNAVNEAEIITEVPQSYITFTFDFALMGQVNKFLKDNGFSKGNYSYLDANTIRIGFDSDKKEEITQKLSALYGIKITE